MKQEILPQPFVFSDTFQASLLSELYENDLIYVEEVFQSSLEELNKHTPLLKSAFTSGDLHALKSHIHKIKPLFGFMGLLKVQDLLQEFENVCLNYDSTGALKPFYDEVQLAICGAIVAIEAEIIRLTGYNQSQL